jgi:signal peptidase I
MFGLFTPRYIKTGKEMLHAARKMFHYKRDLLSPTDLASVETLFTRLATALRTRDRAEVETASEELDRFFGERVPAQNNPELRENCEVFLVAIVIALGIRTFFLQPFTIPTGSMQPTLNGIIATATATPPPNVIVRVVDMALYGRSYFNVISANDDTVRAVRDTTHLIFFTSAEIICDKQRFTVSAPASALMRTFGIVPGTPLKAGQVVARGFSDTGDHVFVNKVAYNFRHPRRGEVFVFNTAGIGTAENVNNPGAPSQFYIKRLAGLPGDELRVDPPRLFVNGAPAVGRAFERVMAGTLYAPKDGYQGYSNGPDFGYLSTPESTFRVPEKRYFAMGDNSYNSSDSRYWGTVPEQNLMGCGMFVYWPFTKHWGLIQ